MCRFAIFLYFFITILLNVVLNLLLYKDISRCFRDINLDGQRVQAKVMSSQKQNFMFNLIISYEVDDVSYTAKASTESFIYGESSYISIIVNDSNRTQFLLPHIVNLRYIYCSCLSLTLFLVGLLMWGTKRATTRLCSNFLKILSSFIFFIFLFSASNELVMHYGWFPYYCDRAVWGGLSVELPRETFIEEVFNRTQIRIQDNHGFLLRPRSHRQQGVIYEVIQWYTEPLLITMSDTYHSVTLVFSKKTVYDNNIAGACVTLVDDTGQISSTIEIYIYDDIDLLPSQLERILVHEIAHCLSLAIEIASNYTVEYFSRIYTPLPYLYQYPNDFDWDTDLHGKYFASHYGMTDLYEDIATILEGMYVRPDELTQQMLQSDSLFYKAQQIRYEVQKWISPNTGDMFAPLERLLVH